MGIYNREQKDRSKSDYWEEPSAKSQAQIDKMEALMAQYGVSVGGKYIWENHQLSIMRVSWPQYAYFKGCEVYRWNRKGEPLMWQAPDNTGVDVDIFYDDWQRMGVDDLEKVFAKLGKPIRVESANILNKETRADRAIIKAAKFKMAGDKAATEIAEAADDKEKGKSRGRAASVLTDYEPVMSANVAPETEAAVSAHRNKK